MPMCWTNPRRCEGFRLGKYDLVIESNNQGGYVYRYDPARPESVLARARVDDSSADRRRSKGSGFHICRCVNRAWLALH